MTDQKFKAGYGDWALVLGAAQGLGEAYARVLAGRGVQLLLTDIQAEKLRQTADDLARAFGVEVRIEVLDLADPGVVPHLLDFVRRVPDCRLFVYCAALAPVKPFLAHQPEELDGCIDTNARALIHLCQAFARHLGERGGGMVLVSSLAGYWGSALLAPYGATKAFILNLGEALFHELRPLGIDVLTVAPGPIATPSYVASLPVEGRRTPRAADPLTVARTSSRRLGRQAVFIPGLGNRLAYFLLGRLLPGRLASWLVNREVRRRYASKRKAPLRPDQK